MVDEGFVTVGSADCLSVWHGFRSHIDWYSLKTFSWNCSLTWSVE